jgi:hypothetical protein
LRKFGEVASEGAEGLEVKVIGATADEGNVVGDGVQGIERRLDVRDVVLEDDV